MVSYIKGLLEEKNADHIVIDTAGIGYNIIVPTTAIAEMPARGESVKIYTYLHVREDAMILYGFLTKEDRETFRLLITVNGIGPKGAIGILSGLSTYDLKIAIMNNDVKSICLAPGIGKKTAQKLILELKDKLKLEDYSEMIGHQISDQSLSANVQSLSIKDEAVEALVSLGYSSNEAIRAVKGISAEGIKVEDVIKEALKNLAIF